MSATPYRKPSPGDLGLRAYRDIFRFAGRARRTEVVGFWIVATLLCGLVILAGWIVPSAFDDTTSRIAMLLPQLPLFALFARRQHDLGIVAWPGVIGLLAVGALSIWRDLAFVSPDVDDLPVPLEILRSAGGILFLLALFWQGQDGANRFGPDPRLEGAER